MRGAFCFRRRRLCLLIRREALLCSVELLNLQEKSKSQLFCCHSGGSGSRRAMEMAQGIEDCRGRENMHVGDRQWQRGLLGEIETGLSPGLLCPASLCSGSQREINVPLRPKLSYLLVESSSSESKKLVVSSSLLMSVEELSYPPRSRRRSPFTVPFTLGAVKRQGLR